MIEFNPDGSIKIPGRLAALREADSSKMKGRCVMIRKEVVSAKPPKSCCLNITLSDSITDNGFIEVIFRRWNESYEVPSKLIKDTDHEFRIEIGTCFTRCSDCSKLIRLYREYDSDVIEKTGSCTYKGNSWGSSSSGGGGSGNGGGNGSRANDGNQKFTEEDYFE